MTNRYEPNNNFDLGDIGKACIKEESLRFDFMSLIKKENKVNFPWRLYKEEKPIDGSGIIFLSYYEELILYFCNWEKSSGREIIAWIYYKEFINSFNYKEFIDIRNRKKLIGRFMKNIFPWRIYQEKKPEDNSTIIFLNYYGNSLEGNLVAHFWDWTKSDIDKEIIAWMYYKDLTDSFIKKFNLEQLDLKQIQERFIGYSGQTLSDCPICGFKIHGDHNAALNILKNTVTDITDKLCMKIRHWGK